MERTEKRKSPYTGLILLCWLVYACSYIGKLNYAANINQIMEFYDVNHADAGSVSTCFFFAYAIGQFVNGAFSKKYNVRWVVTAALLVSGGVNLTIAITDYFPIIKYLWFINGFALSVLWPTLIRLLSETVARKEMPCASVVMGTTVATGTVFIYALSALFAPINFKLAFYTAATILPVIAVIWIALFKSVIGKAKAFEALDDEKEKTEENISERIPATPVSVKTKKKVSFDLMLMIVLLAIFAVGVNLIADGLTTWVPSILKESFGFDDSLSIILTLTLPILAVFANFFAVSVHKKIPDFVSQAALMFGGSGLLILLIIGMFTVRQAVVTIVCFALVRALIGSVNSLITSIFPLFMKGKVNSGMIAGVLNGFCYVGSTASSYGLGLVADHHGWTAVFWLLFAVCALVCVLWIVYVAIKKYKAEKQSKA
ncbi:MAG: MFS transporter [Clostridia bacterium]|nr:MFS transporter [Clostridia bacterium]